MKSRYQVDPGEGYWTTIKNIFKYLRRTNDTFLIYGGEEELSVKGYTNASFQIDKDDSRSQSGFEFFLNGGAVSWKSLKKSIVADSTIKVEYIAASEAAKEAGTSNMCLEFKRSQKGLVGYVDSDYARYMAITDAVKEVIWLRGLFSELVNEKGATAVYCDSQSAIYLTEDQMHHERKKNINIHYNFVQEVIVQ
ncbi:secreted RxLR effector protein 161-like [Gossypium raimondii]|uniref:secreted RxLR effector protein 161-like n=1 Tax=Gossypium raimondii TaxID=29730 RepID=UPI00227BB6B4|nr:secreted RxLR effector protein 161-like [Gossypium raimondii]